MKKISILGSTGSIGTQTLDVVRQMPDAFEIVGLSSGRNITLLKEQILEFTPQLVCVRHDSDVTHVQSFVEEAGLKTMVCYGDEGLIQVATHPDNALLVVAIVGTASLLPTYEAISSGISIALACKEVLVSAGDIIMTLAREKGVSVLPIDSEHAALKQCLVGADADLKNVSKLILTASGGPFREATLETLAKVTVEQALKHPNWDMGAKITIDSATMMNKGLEVIEAYHLFNFPYDQIDVVIHPQSIVHSCVEFVDGSLIAQMGLPDMRLPIQYALTYPEKYPNPFPKTSLSALNSLEFFAPDYTRFPMLKLAFDTGKEGNGLPAVMNAANEQAVALFLDKKIDFLDIHTLVKSMIDRYRGQSLQTLQEIIACDIEVKQKLQKEYE